MSRHDAEEDLRDRGSPFCGHGVAALRRFFQQAAEMLWIRVLSPLRIVLTVAVVLQALPVGSTKL
jgi:hypothetical protein